MKAGRQQGVGWFEWCRGPWAAGWPPVVWCRPWVTRAEQSCLPAGKSHWRRWLRVWVLDWLVFLWESWFLMGSWCCLSELLAKGMYTCTCMAESLRCSPETITALLIGYTPIHKKIQTPPKKRIWCQGRGHLFPVREAPKISKCHKIQKTLLNKPIIAFRLQIFTLKMSISLQGVSLGWLGSVALTGRNRA